MFGFFFLAVLVTFFLGWRGALLMFRFGLAFVLFFVGSAVILYTSWYYVVVPYELKDMFSIAAVLTCMWTPLLMVCGFLISPSGWVAAVRKAVGNNV